MTIGWLVRTSSNSADMSRVGVGLDGIRWSDRRGGVGSDDHHLRPSLTSMASHLAFYLTLFLFFSVNAFQSALMVDVLMSRAQISLVTAKGSKWEATSFCKCTSVPFPPMRTER